MSFKGTMTHLLTRHRFGFLILALASPLTLAQPALAKSPKGASKTDPLYQGAFSTPDGSSDVQAPEVWQDKTGIEVPTLNSFPVRVQVAGSDINGWRQPASVTAPKPIHKNFKINNCQFSVNGGDYSLRRYRVESPEDVSVAADAVMPQSTFSVDQSEGIHFSVTTSLTIATDAKFAQACKETFAGKLYSIGYANLDSSELYGVGERAGVMPAVVFRPSAPAALYVTWDNRTGRLQLVDQIGLVPEVESPVFALTFDKKDSFYLGFGADLKIARGKHKLAGK